LQTTWSEILGARFQRTKVVLFRDVVQSACGTETDAKIGA